MTIEQIVPKGKHMDYVAMGKRIREERKRRKMTQADLAKLIGLSTSHCGNLERGSRIPGLATLALLSQTLSMPLDYLVLGQAADQTTPNNEILANLINIIIEHADEWLPKMRQ